MSCAGMPLTEDRKFYTEAEIEAFSVDELFRLYKSEGCEELKWPLVLRYSGLVKSIALQLRGVYGSFAQVDDIINEGLLALVGAVEKFDLEKGVKFEVYASKRIRGCVIDLVRKQDWVPRSVRHRAKEIDRASSELSAELGRYPTDEEMAKKLGTSTEKYLEELINSSLCSVVSLESIFEDREQGQSISLPDRESSDRPEESFLREELLETLTAGIQTLRENEQMVISLYYNKNLNMKEIAQVMDVSLPRVSQIHARAIQKLRLYMENYVSDGKSI